MRTFFLLFLLLLSFQSRAQMPTWKDKYRCLPAGQIKPGGWLKKQMQKDLAGFVGNLDRLVPDLMSDPIYGSGRLTRHSKVKDLGNNKEGDAEGDEQYKWWNSETQSNWWDGYIRNVFLLDDEAGKAKVRKYVEAILATQDSSGYLGIYDKDLRYRFEGENGELWAKATLLRGLLAYYEYTGEQAVFQAITRAVEDVMQNYPLKASSPFRSGTSFNGGVSHGLTFTDVLDRMYYHTGEQRYREYAAFLYDDFSNTWQSEADAQLKNLLNAAYRPKGHGVHTYEHLRPVLVTHQFKPSEASQTALKNYLDRIAECITPAGGPIGDEWIGERKASPTHTGYEYCSLQEMLDSYGLLYQLSGHHSWGDRMENLFYNAAQGARHPTQSCIAYLKTDNSFEMLGTKNGEVEPDRKQTRYKYSPAHQDVAVCCNPNAGRISPYFIQNAWMKENENTLVATLLLPCTLETTLDGKPVRIENQTDYPNSNSFKLLIRQEESRKLRLKIRKPDWVKKVRNDEGFIEEDGFLVLERTFGKEEVISFSFETSVQVLSDANKEQYVRYGALLYALPIPSQEILGKQYQPGFQDLTYQPVKPRKWTWINGQQPIPLKKTNQLQVQLKDASTQKTETVNLVPIGQTVLRQVTFPLEKP